jgi:hypothetical protein
MRKFITSVNAEEKSNVVDNMSAGMNELTDFYSINTKQLRGGGHQRIKYLIVFLLAVGFIIPNSCQKGQDILLSDAKTQKMMQHSWEEATDFDLENFVTSPDIRMGEFHNNYLDILANSSIFPNQTAYNQYDLIYANLTPQLRQPFNAANISVSFFGDIVNEGLQMNGFDDLITYLQADYPNIVSYLEQMNTHFNDDLPNNFINGDIDNSLAFFLAMRTNIVDSLNGQEKDIMLGMIEIAAYSSVYWYNVLWTDAGESPWHPFFMEEEPLVMEKEGGKFKEIIAKIGKVVAKICVTVATDATCFAVANAVAPGSGVPAAAAGSGAVAVALKDW